MTGRQGPVFFLRLRFSIRQWASWQSRLAASSSAI